MFFFILTRVTKCFARRDGKIDLLGGAAPLSSRKTGYLLRVAHMIPIIFLPPEGHPNPVSGLLLNGFAFLASLIKAWEQLYNTKN